jgi:Putative zinc-finger
MDHRDVVEGFQVERYLLAELSPSESDEFEAHYFECEECAMDLRLTDAFLQQTRRELRSQPHRALVPESRKRLLEFFLRPAWVVPALAAMLLVIAYQNAVVYPRLKREVASLSQPEVLPSLPLVNGNSRGGDVPSFTVEKSRAFLLSVDIPSEEGFSSYVCTLYSPSGSLLWRSEVSTEQARDSVSIRVFPQPQMNGLNLLLIQGVAISGAQKTPVDIVRYRFKLQIQN